MSANIELQGQPSRRLPESAVPEGCHPWGGERVRAWAKAQPPVWVPVRTRSIHVLAVAVVGLVGGFWLANLVDVPPGPAALFSLQLVWTLVRPEVVRVSAPVLFFVLAWYGESRDVATLLATLAVTVTWAMAEIRLSARRTQRQWALAAAEGVTASLPAGVGPLRRGRFLVGLGLVPAVLGGVMVYFGSGLDVAADRLEATLAGWFVVGLGGTLVLSGWLGRRRAAALRGAPVPVLRVLMRDGANGDIEVFAADDVAAVRPLFTVAAEEWYGDEDEDEGDRGLSQEEMDELLDSIENDEGDDEQPGDLREAVLYGAPYEGGEIVIVSVPEDEDVAPGASEDEELVVESSTGPVRALSERAVRRRVGAEKARARRNAAYADRREAAAAVTAEHLGSGAVRRWRAGWLDWAVCLALAVWAALLVLTEVGGWRYIPGALLGLGGAFLLPCMAAWRVTADRDGLWFNGMRRVRHIAWDHVMTVKCEGGELKVDSRRARFGAPWVTHAPRWARLERRFGLIHPYEKAAAEITAMWKDPALRPTEASAERARGRVLWPLGVVLAVLWVAVLVLVP
ncbi:hypothetical protein [Streptomyces tailanensis]|uniref:hypothetical protein n=1 Tax=Streptomyces tailanensis TaxID=2569858 RepID=UPI00122DE431|nr:hypothetical protein [Streptomyces tailanensis]